MSQFYQGDDNDADGQDDNALTAPDAVGVNVTIVGVYAAAAATTTDDDDDDDDDDVRERERKKERERDEMDGVERRQAVYIVMVNVMAVCVRFSLEAETINQ